MAKKVVLAKVKITNIYANNYWSSFIYHDKKIRTKIVITFLEERDEDLEGHDYERMVRIKKEDAIFYKENGGKRERPITHTIKMEECAGSPYKTVRSGMINYRSHFNIGDEVYIPCEVEEEKEGYIYLNTWSNADPYEEVGHQLDYTGYYDVYDEDVFVTAEEAKKMRH